MTGIVSRWAVRSSTLAQERIIPPGGDAPAWYMARTTIKN